MSAVSHGSRLAAFLGTAAVMGAVLAMLAGVAVDKVSTKVLPALPPACPEQSLTAAPMQELSVRIFNAAQADGLAASVAAKLKSAGIAVSSVGNSAAPTFSDPAADAVITAGKGELAKALGLQQMFPGSVFLVDDEAGLSLYLISKSPVVADAPSSENATLRCALNE